MGKQSFGGVLGGTFGSSPAPQSQNHYAYNYEVSYGLFFGPFE
jgi:hypothetical protein